MTQDRNAESGGPHTDADDPRYRCPFSGCDWTSRPYDPRDHGMVLAREMDAEMHWREEHGGKVPEGADFGRFQCPECHALDGLDGSVSCGECGYIPPEARA
jgi:hypothetical protein